MSRTLVELWDGCWRVAEDIIGVRVHHVDRSYDNKPDYFYVSVDFVGNVDLRSDDFATKDEARKLAQAIGERVKAATTPVQPHPHYVPYPVPAEPRPTTPAYPTWEQWQYGPVTCGPNAGYSRTYAQ